MNTRFKYFTLITLFTFAFSINRIRDWESWTSPLIVHDLTELEGKIYSATEGGVLIFDLDDQSFETLTNIDELIGTNLKVIETDQFGNIWIGGASPNGFIQVYNPTGRNSINEFDFGLTEIIDIAIADTVALAVYKDNQDFGIQKFLYSNNKWQHNDLMTVNWLLESTDVSGIEIWNDQVFVGTNEGLYSGTIHTDPIDWTIPFIEWEGDVSCLSLHNEELVVVCDKNVYRLDNLSSEITIIADYLNYKFQDIVKSADGSYFGIYSDAMIKLGEIEYEWYFHFPGNAVHKLLASESGHVIAGTKSGLGFLNEELQTFEYRIPNAPLTNQFSAITTLNDGRIVAGSKYGLAIKESWGWRNIVETTGTDTIIHSSFDHDTFAADTLPIDFGGFVADIEQGPDGLVYCAIRGTYPEPIRHGGGVVIIDIDNPVNYTLIDTSRLDYWYVSGNSNPYMVVKDLEFDRDGNLWIADTYSRNAYKPISVRTPEDEWGSYFVTNANMSITPNTIAIDYWNRVWIGAFEGTENTGEGNAVQNGGLVMLEYSGSPANPESFSIVQYDEGNSDSNVNLSLGSGNNTVWSLGIDHNRMWALTRVGLIYFDLYGSSERPITRQGPKSTSNTLLAYFPNVSFGDGSKLKIDPRGNIWTLSPTDGIHVLLSNGIYWPDYDPQQEIEGIKTESSKLLSNEVTDIAFDPVEGLAYITSKQGINVLKIPFADSKADYNEMRIFPSPFHIPSLKPLIVDGLMDGSSLMVMTLSGKVIRHIKDVQLGENGYQIPWNGKDKKGEWVGSGVYLLSVYDPNGNTNIGKITVICH